MKYLFILFIGLSAFSQQKNPATKHTYKHSYYSLGEEFVNEDYLYLFANNIAKYERKTNAKTRKKEGFTFGSAAQHILIYSNPEKSVMNRTLDDNKTVVYAEWNVGDIEWEITDEEKQMGPYKAIKATANTFHESEDDPFYPGKAIVWFTPDLPYSFGPMGYNGLPGLVLLLTFENSAESYSLVAAEQVEDVELSGLNIELRVDKETIFKRPEEIFDAIEKK